MHLSDFIHRFLWDLGQTNAKKKKLKKILIVEDDERLARLTQNYLIRNGLEVGVETDGNRAIRRIISEQPDLVVLDDVTRADGLTVCRSSSTLSSTNFDVNSTYRRYGSGAWLGNGRR